MDYTDAAIEPEETSAIIVKADEVDEAGADISTISPRNSSGAEFDERIESRRAQDAQARGSPKVLANAVPSPPKSITRPNLRRDGSATLPPQQPPPPTPPQQRDDPGNHTDSLSLMQLRRLVTDLPKLEPVAYAYEYEDTRAFPEELEEWFQYTEEERHSLLKAKQTFEEKWEQAQASRHDPSNKALEWTEVGSADRESFLIGSLQALSNSETSTRVKILECISYIALGVWGETAGLVVENDSPSVYKGDTKPSDSRYNKSKSQLNWIYDGANLLRKVGAIRYLIDVLRKFCESDQESGPVIDQSSGDEEMMTSKFLIQIEINHSLTALYILVEVGRRQQNREEAFLMRQAFADIEPSMLLLLIRILAKLRWEETSIFPLPRVLLLLWKSILLLFGNSQELKESKAILRDTSDESTSEQGQNFITASPLDYHLFRQEITSKYPSYSPPLPLVPIELENNSILPPLPNHPSKRTSHEVLHPRAGPDINGGGSIFNQPVHIATPAPSPPPSPAGPGGKGGKKQNYQTNQNFPFLYPPLDDASNIVGGKGNAERQDQLVGKRWEGSDVPASILEAGQLFASRVRMSRSIRQLWDVREKFIKHERGWNGTAEVDKVLEPLNGDTDDELISNEENCKKEVDKSRETENETVQRRLDTVEDFYRTSLPHLQSLIIVLWKATFANVSALVSQSNGLNGMQNGFNFSDENVDPQGKRKSNPNSAVQLNGTANAQLSEDGTDVVVDELNAIRSREITSKAVSGIILMLLKWFKLSHILKFEYLTQLLLDANYIPLILKLFAHQDIDRAVDQRNDREDLDFFNFCLVNSKHPSTSVPQPLPSPSPSSEEDSAPPPIRTHRRSPTSDSPPPPPSPPPLPRPEVDELGYPTTGTLPSSPLTTYSPRFFFTTITLLRLLQKITKRKAHRALLLVQYKSSTILRRTLKIPQPDLRLYTLKLFKSQVPYCGRKWRQTNMRVITAIYLHCKPELRDEWLCGGDVDGVVEEAVPLEQAGRSLVHWWHLREYRNVMEGVGGRAEGPEDEGNFFERELEKMGWGVVGGGAGGGGAGGGGGGGGEAGAGGGGGGGGGEEDEGMGAAGTQGGGGGSEWEGGPLQLEGWA